MIQGIDVNQRIEFTLEDDKEPKTVFVFKPLSGFEMIKINDSGDYTRAYLETTIAEIIGVSDKDKFLSSLSINHLGKLIKKANDINGISEQEIKN